MKTKMFCRTCGRGLDGTVVFQNILNNRSTFWCVLPCWRHLTMSSTLVFKVLAARAAPHTAGGAHRSLRGGLVSREQALWLSGEFQGPPESLWVFSKAGDVEVSPPRPSGSPLGSVVPRIPKISCTFPASTSPRLHNWGGFVFLSSSDFIY